ncbi:tail tape measure protein [Sinorhizobium meliloti]|uniref:tail tape measure protein n=1 Tax=Rhizobium meliloti TaxID=382 RepID=UPI00299D0ABB|nr:tail tape measure protein [Sinorhizobium meliloti]MDW9997104.1 tail tape measure protein [Sinorhizobium meliloti]
MPDDTERLVVALEARIRDFERNMAKAERTGTRSYQQLASGSARATRMMEADMSRSSRRINQALASVSMNIGGFGKAFAGGVIAAGIAGITSVLNEAVASTAELGRQARMAGVDVEAFQELKFVAEQNRIGVDALTDGLKELNLRADEFITTGAGSAAEAFQRLGYSSDELAKKIKNPSELFVEIIGRMQAFDRAAQIRLGDELFGGTAGERFVELVDKGAAGLREQIRLANELGLVMDREMIASAEDVDRKFNLIVSTVGTHLKAAIVDAVSAWFRFVDSYREFEQQQGTTLQARVDDLITQKQQIAQQIDEATKERAALGDTGAGGMIDASIAELKEQIAKLDAEENQIISVLSKRSGFGEPRPAQEQVPAPQDNTAQYIEEYRTELAKTNRERLIAAETEKILADAAGRGAKLTQEQAAALAEETIKRNESEAAGRKAASTADRGARATEGERERIRELIGELEQELSLVWATDEAKRAASASRMAGADATEEERQKVIALNEALHQEEEARAKMEDGIAFRRELARGALDDLKYALEDGKLSWAELGDIAMSTLDRITDKLLDDVVDAFGQVNKAAGSGGSFLGGGFLSSIFGGLFRSQASIASNGGIGLYADGGISDKPAIFGEAGPEAAVPLPDGRRIPVDLRQQGAAGGDSKLKVDVGVTFENNGEFRAYVRGVSQEAASDVTAQSLRQYQRNRDDLYTAGEDVR